MDVGLSLEPVSNVTVMHMPGFTLKEEDDIKVECYGHMIAYQDEHDDEEEKPFAEFDCKTETDIAEFACHVVKVEVKKEEEEHSHLIESKSL